MERINRCINKLAFNFETLWFLDVLYNINIAVMDKDKCPSPTACVMFKDFKISMFFNREFIDKLDDDELLGVILHETLHLALYHNVRNVDKNMQLWNIACDLEVNSIIDSMKFKLPEGGLMPQRDFKLESRLSAENYYDAIYRKIEDQKKNGNGGQGGFSIEGIGTLDDHSQWSKTESESEMVKQMVDTVVKPAIQKNENDINRSSIKDNITEALREVSGKKNRSARYGDQPGNYISKINVTSNGKVKWNYILNRLIRRTLSSNYTPSFKRTSRRYGELVKGKIKNHKIDSIVVAVDTSGSINRDLHERFMEEIILIRRMFKIEIRYIQCDTEVTQDIKLKRYTNVEDIAIKGGGGTDFRPVFDYIKQKNYKPNAILYFTDGQGAYPEKSNIDTLWIIDSEESLSYGYNPPFGYKLFLDEK
jgi:predicted metal-dependent peptidase